MINNKKCEINCATENVIYMIECQACKIQYVGETSQKLSERFSDHRSRISNYNSTKKDTLLIKHFNEGECKNRIYNVKILETIKGNPKKNGKLDNTVTVLRRKREDYWMERLHTVYPYGLNNRLGKNLDQHDDKESIQKEFWPKNRRRKKKKHSRRTQNTPALLADTVYEDIVGVFKVETGYNPGRISTAISKACKIIPSMRISEIQKLGIIALDDTMEETCIPIRVLQVILDICKRRLNRKENKKTRTEVTNTRKIDLAFIVRYQNHGIDKLKINSILQSQEAKDAIPTNTNEDSEPMLVYKYLPTIRGKIFNYKNTVKEYVHHNHEEIECDCSKSKFKDKDHNHVVTGELGIINNKRLRKLFSKGPNFREKQTIDWKKTYSSLKKDVNDNVKRWSKKMKIAIDYFNEWKNTVLQKIKQEISQLRKKINTRPVKKTLEDKDCKQELEDLKRKYVIVPIDKAANNIGFICKKYFLEILCKETESETYELIDETVEDIVGKIKRESSAIGIPVEEEFNDLPQIHATIKMHKNPIKFRFIIGSRTCALKPAAKKLVKILKLAMDCNRKYCEKVKLYTGIERFWIAENNSIFLEQVQAINRRNNARNIQTFDFSTLYTKIPQDDLKEKLKEVVTKAFKGGRNQFIRVTHNEAKWNKNEKGDTYSKEAVFNLIDLVVDNSYFRFGQRVYRQKTGIPMGIDPAPQMANLYLHFYEAAYMEELAKTNYGAAKKFNKTCRFIDDLSTLNNDGLMMSEKEKIYPKELVLNLENDENSKATFLDIEAHIERGYIHTKTYDKREAFNFDIVNYPDLSGNIPHHPAYGVFISQLIRHARICSKREELFKTIDTLIAKLLKKGFHIHRLRNTYWKTLGRYNWIRKKLNNTSPKMLDRK